MGFSVPGIAGLGVMGFGVFRGFRASGLGVMGFGCPLNVAGFRVLGCRV